MSLEDERAALEALSDEELTERALTDLHDIIEGSFLTVRENFDDLMESFVQAFIETQGPDYEPSEAQLELVYLTLVASFSSLGEVMEDMIASNQTPASARQSLAVMRAVKKYAKENLDHWTVLKGAEAEGRLVPEADGEN